MMKKTLILLLAALLTLSALACAGNEAKPVEAAPAPTAQQPTEAPKTETPAPDDGFKTLGDVLDCESPASGYSDDLYIYVFVKDGVYYRAEADITEKISQSLSDIDFFDPDRDQKTRDLLSDLPIRKLYDLSEVLIPQADLSALAGRTGQDLLDMGFVPSGSYGFGDGFATAFLEKGPFEYQFDFAESVDLPEGDVNVAEVIRPLTVKAASFGGNLASYATDLEFDLNGGRSLEECEADFTDEPLQTAYVIQEIPVEESPFKTLADVFAVRDEHYSSCMTPDLYVIAFSAEGVYYRVEAAITPEIEAQADAIDFFDEARDQKLDALLGPMAVTRVVDLSAGMPTQAELDSLIGVTGRDLLDAGFTYGSGYSFWDKAEMYLVRGLYEYHVVFNEKVPEREDYDAVLDELMPTLTVANVEFFQLADACSDPELIW